jgi:hypothetical protein
LASHAWSSGRYPRPANGGRIRPSLLVWQTSLLLTDVRLVAPGGFSTGFACPASTTRAGLSGRSAPPTRSLHSLFGYQSVQHRGTGVIQHNAERHPCVHRLPCVTPLYPKSWKTASGRCNGLIVPHRHPGQHQHHAGRGGPQALCARNGASLAGCQNRCGEGKSPG